PRRRAHRRRLRLGARRHRGGACLGERRRRLPRDAAHAADVQEKAEMTANQLTLWYLVASICFILALKGLSSPTTARRGNYFGMAGMAIAVLTTIAVVARGRVDLILIAMLIGGTVGAIVARRVQMTQMPEPVAAMHALVMIGLGAAFFLAPDKLWAPFLAMTALAFTLGVLIIIPIGGADMPVVISMLNSYSGWAAAGIGFSLNNAMLIIAGSLVGSSGAILSYIMCRAMNRSFISVILGGFGAETGSAATDAGQKTVRSGS